MLFLTAYRWFFKPRIVRYFFMIAGLTVANMMQVIPARLLGDLVDTMNARQLTETELARITILLIMVAIAHYASALVWTSTLFGGEALVQRLLRSRMFRHLTRMPPDYYRKHSTGTLGVVFNNDIPTISDTFGFGILTLLSSIAGFVVLVPSIGTLTNWPLTLLVLTPMPVILLWVRFASRQVGLQWGALNEAKEKMGRTVYESVYGVRVLRSFGAESRFFRLFDVRNREVALRSRKLGLWESFIQPVVSLLIGISYVLAVAYGAYLISKGELTAGQLVGITLYIGMLHWPVTATGDFLGYFERGKISHQRMQAVMEVLPEGPDHSGPPVPEEPGDIEFEGYSCRFPGAAAEMLRSVTLRVKKGQTTAVVGKTGCGKSTLLSGLLWPHSSAAGEIRISGVRIGDIPGSRIRDWIGYVPQRDALISGSVRDNIALGMPNASDEEVADAVHAAMLDDDVRNWPGGLDTWIGEGGVKVSGGQKQRIALARALLKRPPILLLDDALTALDAQTEAEVIDRLFRRSQGSTILIATNRMSVARRADRIVVLDEGRIAEQGTFEQLVRGGGWFQRQYGRQAAERQLAEEERRFACD